MQRAVLHEHRRDRTLARIELRFEHGAVRPAVGLAFRSSISACSRIWSSSASTPVPFLAEISACSVCAAELLEHDAVRQQVLLDLLHVRRGQIDLVDGDDHRHAGVLGVRDRLDRLRHDLSSAATTSTTMSVTCAPRARMAVNASWPGVSRKVICLPLGSVDVVRADVLRDAAGLARDDVRLADVVEQRRLAVVDVTHDRDDRRPRLERLRRRRLDGLDRRRGVLLFAHRLEAELAGDQLDLVEVEALIDRDHQPQILEGERHDLGRRHLEHVRRAR